MVTYKDPKRSSGMSEGFEPPAMHKVRKMLEKKENILKKGLPETLLRITYEELLPIAFQYMLYQNYKQVKQIMENREEFDSINKK